jgi:hypothetical protein
MVISFQNLRMSQLNHGGHTRLPVSSSVTLQGAVQNALIFRLPCPYDEVERSKSTTIFKGVVDVTSSWTS